MRHISMATRDELLKATILRYREGTRGERSRMLDEFAALSGYHRKHAMRLLRGPAPRAPSPERPERRRYGPIIREALISLWEASDRICGKRLKPLLPILVASMESHGHLVLDALVRDQLLQMSAATIDRALRDTRSHANKLNGRRRSKPTGIRASVPIRTFADWNDPAPGFCEADLVAHSGPVANGSFIQTLVLTDIATGWTECAPLIVRQQTVLTEVLKTMRRSMPFPLLGFDTDNDTVFMNETVRDYCAAESIVFTRCRPYRKNDQAWVEQKNGAIVRRIVGYRRYEGFKTARILAQLYASVRLFVNFFQPSFKLAGKERHGGRIRKRYHPPATPFQRLLADPRTSETTRLRLEILAKDLDPVRLLRDIRAQQEELVRIADESPAHLGADKSGNATPTIDEFLVGLRTAWKTGDARPTSRPKPMLKRERRRPDPLINITETLHAWFTAEPNQTARQLLSRLQDDYPGAYPDELLRTLQRRVKIWRHDAASQLVVGWMSNLPDAVLVQPQP
ncbi:MAG: transposase [Beijerinckiaceae bacterium]|jgi:hypothetical protein